ncbi:MAG: S8 family serine peptidase [Planctomycetes bacterium]|nr:S8 family serine peptidase [Planctomycetota bacterium]
MASLRTVLWCSLAAPAVFGQAAFAQSQRPQPPSRTLEEALARSQASAALLRAKEGTSASDMAARQIVGEALDMGAPAEFGAPLLDDSIPLPTPPRRAVVDGLDRELEPASGDPFFLGFSGGAYYPPQGESIDPLLVQQIQAQYVDGRPTQDTYAFVMFQKRMTEARVAALRDLGVRVLEFHPHYTLKVALAPALVDSVAALDFVRWVGVPRAAQKVHPVLREQLAKFEPGTKLDVYIDVFDSDLCADSREIVVAQPTLQAPGGVSEVDPDGHPATKWISNGWQQRALEALGIEVTEYVDGVRAFRARLQPANLELLLALDFVQFVEADLPPTLMSAPEPHDESTPMVYSDLNRAFYNGSSSDSAVGGFADSGLYGAHTDLGIWAVGWDFTGSTGAWADGCTHGSHVAGTILGRGNGDASHRGQAPGLGDYGGTGRFFNARIFGDGCGFSGSSLATIMSVLNTSYFDGTSTTPRPHVINHSWGTSGGPYSGTEADARTIDNEVHNNAQLHIWASGNQGTDTTNGSLLLQATSKNSCTVGSVVDYPSASYGDPGELYDSLFDGSSTGPAGDGRWKPNVVAPGRWITSVAANTASSYSDKYGTSMATPHVTGLAAELVDHFTGFQGWPEPLNALLMATATTKDDFAPTFPTDLHLDQFGAGRIEGYRAHWTTGQIATYFWYFGIGNNSTYVEFPVNAGATRLVTVMHYSEPAASSGASQALVNNYDSYIDFPPVDTANSNTGDFFVQQSAIDNTEIRSISSPANYATGTWRVKVHPASVSGSAYMGVVVQVIYGDTTPDGSLTLTADDYFVTPNQNVDITASVYNPDFVASAVVLDSTSAGDSLQAATTTLGDGAVTNLLGNDNFGRDLTLGDIIHGSSRSARWTTRWASEGVKSFQVQARSDNWVDETQSINITVDGTAPGLPTPITSSTHTVNVWSNNPNVTINWGAATDNLSGVDGYGVSWGTTVAGAQPANIKDTEETSPTWNVTWSSNASWYFGLNTVDNSGNWSVGYATAGPFKIDTVAPTQAGVISSTTHTLGVQSCNTTVNVQWGAASDALSGLAGYLGVWNTTAVFDPVGSPNLGAGATSFSSNIGSTNTARYFHLRSKDVAGNYGATRHFGPILANATSVSTYCTGKTNSLGCVPVIGSNGVQPDKSAGTFAVTCSNVLNQKNGLLFWGFTASAVPFQGGLKCVASPVVRGPNISSGGASSGSSCTGSYVHVWSTAYMNTYGLVPGNTVFCQWWMRDPASASTTGLSNALQFTICE